MVNYAVITGASSGIGRAYAKYLGPRNEHALLLVARREDRLRELQQQIQQQRQVQWGDQALPVEWKLVDLTVDRHVDSLVEYFKQEDRVVDWLVNCAGSATLGAFYKARFDAEVGVLNLNCVVPMKLISAWVPAMVARGAGTVINVSSIGAFQPAPYMAVYAASKTFVLNYTLAIAEELRDTGVRVFAHCPGPTKTEFHLVAGLPEDMSPMPPMTADDSVKEAMVALKKNKRYLLNGWINRWMVRMGRFLSPDRSAKMAEKVLLSRWTPDD